VTGIDVDGLRRAVLVDRERLVGVVVLDRQRDAAGAAGTGTGSRCHRWREASLDPEHLVLDVVALRAVRLDGQLDVESLLRMRRESLERRRQVVLLERVARVSRAMTGERERVGEQLGVARRWLRVERDSGRARPFVEPEPLDEEAATDVRFIVMA